MKELWILPDGERVDERLISAALPGHALRADGVISFGKLIDLLCRGDPRLVAEELLALTILGGCALRVDLGPFHPVRESPGFIRAAREVVGALKAGGMDAGEFSEACSRLERGAGGGTTQRALRGKALARLFVEYQRRLTALNVCDPEDRLLTAAQRMRGDSALPALDGFDELHIQGLHDLPPARLELLLALARRASKGGPRVVLHLPYAGSARVNAFLEPVFRLIEGRGTDIEGIEVVAEDPAERPGVGSQLAGALFGGQGRPPTPGWSTFTAASPIQEAREVAHRVRRLVDGGAAIDDIAIGVRESGEWVDRLAEALENQGLRVRMPHGAPLASAPPVRLALELLELAANHHPREPFAALLGSRYLRCAVSEQLGGAAALLREAGVRDDQFGGGYRARLGALASRLLEANDRERAAGVSRTSAALDQVLRILGELPPVGTAAVHCRALNRVMESLGIVKAAQAFSDAEATTADTRLLSSLARDQVALDGLRHLLSAIPNAFAAAGRSGESLSRDHFSLLVADAAASTLLAVRGPRGGAIRILDVRSLPGRKVAHLFLPALTDGVFPTRPEPHPLFPEDDRARINALAGRPVFRAPAPGADAGPLPSRQSEEPLLFYLALCAAQESVQLSCPRMDFAGREALASPFFDEVERRTASLAHAVPLQPIVPLASAHTVEEVMARVARDQLSSFHLRAPDAVARTLALRRSLERRVPSRWMSIVRRAVMERERIEFLADPQAEPGPYSGRLAAPDASPALARIFEFGANHPLTAKHLEEFGTCAFKTFAGRALKLAAAEEVGEESDAATRGTLLHRILSAFFERMKAENRLPLNGRPEEKVILEEVAARKLEEAERELYLGHPELWALRRQDEMAKLQRTLEEEQRQPRFPGLVPARFEVASSERQISPVPIPSRDGSEILFLGGAIDRIDEGAGVAAVIDYKSSKGPRLRKKLKDELLETEFQLIAYLILVKGSLRHAPVDAAFVSLRDQKAFTLSHALAQRAGGERIDELIALDPLEREAVRAEGRRTFADRAWEMVSAMRSGEFGVRPLDCRTCDFKGVCRVGAGSLAGDDA